MRFSQFSYFSANSCSIVVCIGMLSRIIRANLVSMTRCMTRYIVCYGISWDCTIYYFGSNMRNKYSGLFLLKKSSQNNKHVQNLIVIEIVAFFDHEFCKKILHLFAQEMEHCGLVQFSLHILCMDANEKKERKGARFKTMLEIMMCIQIQYQQ